MKPFLLLFYFLLPLISLAAEDRTVYLDDNISELWINKQRSSILEDSTCSLSIKEVQQLPFAPVTQNNPLNTNTSSDYWIKFLLVDHRVNNTEFRIELYDFDIDEISLYQQDKNGNYLSHTAGYGLPFNTRQINHKNVSFRIAPIYNDSAYVYMKFHSSKHNLLKPVIRPYDVIIHYSLNEYILFGVFYGLLILMIFYNLLYHFYLGSSSSLFYVLYAFLVLLFFMAENGTGFQYLWPDSPNINPYIGAFALIASEVAVLLFTQSFLELRKNHKKLYKAVQYLIPIRIFLGILQFSFPHGNNWEFVNILFVQIVLAIGIQSWRKGNVVARWFVFAFCTLNIAFLITFLERLSIFPSSIFTVYAFYLGVIGQFVFLSISIAGAIKETYDQRDDAKKNLIIEFKKNEELKEKVNRELEDKVKQRTIEIEKQKGIVEHKNDEIMSSVRYAKNIQSAVLPSDEYLKEILGDNFVLFMPRDIVSGDFYWLYQINNDEYLVAAVDCTGHGVPGAFMSMIGVNLLNQIVSEGCHSPSEILSKLHNNVQAVLRQKKSQNVDGMDMALCYVNKKTKKLQYAGAKNPLVYIQDNEIHKVRASKHPIGGAQQENNLSYDLHEFSFEKSPISFYIFSDGYVDQFGGEFDKKFYIKNLISLLFENKDLPMDKQKRVLIDTILNWMGNDQAQIDDILLLGIKEG